MGKLLLPVVRRQVFVLSICFHLDMPPVGVRLERFTHTGTTMPTCTPRCSEYRKLLVTGAASSGQAAAGGFVVLVFMYHLVLLCFII